MDLYTDVDTWCIDPVDVLLPYVDTCLKPRTERGVETGKNRSLMLGVKEVPQKRSKRRGRRLVGSTLNQHLE